MKKLLICYLAVPAACFLTAAGHAGKARAGLPVRAAVRVPFMPKVAPPPPPKVVYPAGWSNECVLTRGAIRKAQSVTNLYRMGAAERDALCRHWVEDFRTNGVPEEFRDR